MFFKDDLSSVTIYFEAFLYLPPYFSFFFFPAGAQDGFCLALCIFQFSSFYFIFGNPSSSAAVSFCLSFFFFFALFFPLDRTIPKIIGIMDHFSTCTKRV